MFAKKISSFCEVTLHHWLAKLIQLSTSIIVLLVSAAVSVASSLFSDVDTATSSNGW